MRRLTVRVLGIPVFCVDICDYEYVDESDGEIGGGSSHNFTMSGAFVDERFLPWDESDRFGFS